MSVNAEIVQCLLDARMGGAEILTVAKAMERGDNARTVFILLDALRGAGAPNAAIGLAVHEVALKIEETNYHGCPYRPRDEHTQKKDSNRSRRGLSWQRWQTLRDATFERDGWACVYCGSPEDLTCDHVVPLVRGGSNDNANLATACRSCNSSKGDKLLTEWRRHGN